MDGNPEPDVTPVYSADLYVPGSGDGVPVYPDRVVIIFAKTDGHISGYADYQVFDASGQREHADMIGMPYADIEGVDNYVCRVTRNGATKSCWVCPDSATGTIDSCSKIDFTDLDQVLHFDPDALRGLSLQAELSSGADK